MKYLVSCYTTDNEPGIYLIDVHDDNITIVDRNAEIPNTSYLCLSEDKDHIFSASEFSDDSFAVYDLDQSCIRFDSKCSCALNGPCHLVCSADGKEVYTANYDTGSISIYDITGDRPALKQLIYHGGKGFDAVRQEAPHVHQIIPDPFDRSLFWVIDLGLDSISGYKKNSVGYYELQTVFHMPQGSGPRHMVFSEDGTYAYVCCELTSEIMVLKRDEGAFTIEQILSTLPDGYPTETSWCSAIKLIKDKLYISNRGHDSIAEFNITDQGLLCDPRFIGTGVSFPRDFHICGDESMLVCGQRSDNIKLLTKAEDGVYREAAALNINSPVCIIPAERK